MEKNELNKLVAEILNEITQRYILSNYKIPADVLALKDEVMEIYDSLHKEEDESVLAKHEARLTEIRDLIGELNFLPHK